MAISGFDVDVVRKDAAGIESKVKLSDHYLHHYILAMGDNSTMMKIQEQGCQGRDVCSDASWMPWHDAVACTVFSDELDRYPRAGVLWQCGWR